jgi:MFS family permease
MWRRVFLPTIVLSFAEGMLIPVLPLYLAATGVPLWWVGLVLAAEGIGMLLGDIPAGAVLRRVDHRTTMLIGIAVLGIVNWSFAATPTVAAMVALRIAAGIGSSLWGISRHAFLTVHVPVGLRGRMISTFGGTQRVGSLLGPLLGGALAVSFGYGAVFHAYGIAALATFVYCAIVLERGGVLHGRETERSHREAWALVWRVGGRALLFGGAANLFAQTIRAGRRVVIPLVGALALGLDVGQVAWIVAAAAAFDVAFFPLAGVLMDRFGRKWAVVPSFTLQGIGMLLVPLAGGFWGLAAAAALIGLGNGLGSGTMMTVGADLAPREAMGEFLGLWRWIGDGGSMLAPLAVGFLAGAFGLGLATVVIAGSGFAAAAVFAFGLPETYRRAG